MSMKLLLESFREYAQELLKEKDLSSNKIMYHWTRKSNLESIQKNGLKINQPSEYLIAREEMQKIYDCIPICLSTNKSDFYGGEGFVLLEINVAGINLLPDIFSMIDKGAYIEEDHLWFERVPKALKSVDWYDGTFYYNDLFSEQHLIEASIKLTETVCITENIEPSRINVYNKKLEEERKLGKPSSETNLGDWFKRKGAPGKKGGWVDCNTCRDGKCKPCGRQEGEKRSKYPRCRPTPAQCKGYKRRSDNLQEKTSDQD